MEAVLAAGESASPFNRYVLDSVPSHRKVVQDYITRIRYEIVRALSSEDLQPAPPRIRATHALRTHLSFIDVAIEELRPSYMRGYGDLSPEAGGRLDGLIAALQATVAKLDRYLARRPADPERRLLDLERAGRDVSALRVLEDVITRDGLTEFQPALDLLLDRHENRHFEVAVFGRVSTGKSSLLNHLLRTDVLPVGVNPITAIPTRIVYGSAARASIEFLSGEHQTIDVRNLRDFVSEDGNPGNVRRVSKVIVSIPADRLREGVVLVDTPGLGSLATVGAAETLAYLPRCDIALVLIDATSTLTADDAATVRALLDAGTPVLVLLSKADLIAPLDLARVHDYVGLQLRNELGLPGPVGVVSVAPAFDDALDRWFVDYLEPLFVRHEELRRQSIARKTGALVEAVAATLERVANRPISSGAEKADSDNLDRRFRDMARELEGIRAEGEALLTDMPAAWHVVVTHAAEGIASEPSGRGGVDPRAALESAMDDVMRPAAASLIALVKRAIVSTRSLLDDPGSVESLSDREMVRELPRPDVPKLDLRIGTGPLRILSARLARNTIERSIEQKAGHVIQAAVGTHAALLRQWFLRAMARIKTEFELVADAQRARTNVFERLGAAGMDRAALAADLRRLRDLIESDADRSEQLQHARDDA
jgi:GTP-binding protein EngB required for normal cell division